MLKRLIQTLQLLYVKIKWIIFGESKSQQIELFLPINTNVKFQHSMLPEDYKLRTYLKNDFTELQQLYLNVGFKDE